MLHNFYQKGASVGWMPDADSVNAPSGALLRADNIVKDEAGTPTLRRGTALVYSGLTATGGTTGVQSIYSVELPAPDEDGTTYDMAVSDDSLFINGTRQAEVSFDSSGDVAFADDSYQIFCARGTEKKKWDGATLYDWPLPTPTVAATVAAAAVNSLTVFNFNNSTDTSTPSGTNVITTHEGTSAYRTAHDGTTANGAQEFTPDPKTGRISVSKVFGADQNFFTINSVTGGQTDLIDFYVWLEEPRKVDKIRIVFGMDASGDPFKTDAYHFDFDIKGGAVQADIKDPISYGAAAYAKAVTKMQQVLTPADVTKVRTPTQVKDVLKRLGRQAGAVSSARMDAQQSSPAWCHFTVTRGQFKRRGGTAGREWSTVKGIKLVAICTPGSTEKVAFDDVVVIGGGDRAFTGKFRVVYRFVRDTGQYYELGPCSPESSEITLNQQALSITVSATALQQVDEQVNQIWAYLFGGFLDTYYRVAVFGSGGGTSNMTLDEFQGTADGLPTGAGPWFGGESKSDAEKSAVNDVRRGMALEMGYAPAKGASTDLVYTLRKTELDIFTDNISLEPGAIGIPDNIIAIAGPWRNRMFLVTDEGYVYPTTQTSPSNCSVFHVLDARRYGDPMWAVLTTGGVYVGCTKDVVRVGGTGDESEDHSIVDLWLEPQNLANPPMDKCVYTDGNTIVFRSADGLQMLTGSTLTPVSPGSTSLLWRGQTRHSLSPLNVATGRFRVAVDNRILYLIVTEGTGTEPTAIWRVNLADETKIWCRTTYGTEVPLSITRNNLDGRLLVGTRSGKLLQLESGVQDEGTTDIDVNILTPWLDLGSPLERKVPTDFQLHCDTSANAATLAVYLDGSSSAADTYEVTTAGPDVYRLNVSALDPFLRCQFGITGSFDGFALHALNLVTRSLGQHFMAVDTGYIRPPEPNDFLWLQELEVDVKSPSNLTAAVYIDDTLHSTYTVTVTANLRKPYKVPLLRTTKGYNIRVLLATTASDGAGQIGFECFRIRGRQAGSGNMFEIPFSISPPGGSE